MKPPVEEATPAEAKEAEPAEAQPANMLISLEKQKLGIKSGRVEILKSFDSIIERVADGDENEIH